MRFIPQLLVLVLTAIAGGCTQGVRLPCDSGQDGWLLESLYFGTAGPNGPVTPDQWQAFVDEVVTPRFPDGFSVLTGSGQWKTAAGTLIKEQSHLISLVHPDSQAARVQILDIIQTYKTRFGQESVLRIQAPVCASF